MIEATDAVEIRAEALRATAEAEERSALRWRWLRKLRASWTIYRRARLGWRSAEVRLRSEAAAKLLATDLEAHGFQAIVSEGTDAFNRALWWVTARWFPECNG